MEIEKVLEKIGLDIKESKIYLALLNLGESTVLPIARKSGIQRTYCYDILASLAQKGMVSYVEKRGRRRYTATEPAVVKKLLTDKINQFDRILPNLEGLYQKTSLKPKVRFFEGPEALEIIHQEILREAKEVWFVGSIEDWAKKFPNYIDYIKAQVGKGIKIRDLVRHGSGEAMKYAHLYKKPLQELRFLPENAKFATDNMVWNNKFVMISYGADLYAVSIESTEIAQTMKIIFELLWNKSKKISSE